MSVVWKNQTFWEIRCTDIKNICQYKKIEENRCSDIKRICQHQAKMNADVKMLCQDQKKWKKKHKIEATDVKNIRQNSKKQKWTVEAFYCWRKIIMSVVSKNEKNQPKNWNFIDWRMDFTSTLKVFFAFGMHWQKKIMSVK